MKIFCIIDLVYVENECPKCTSAWEANVPEEIIYQEIAVPNALVSKWGLYLCEYDDEKPLLKSMMAVPESLTDLLFSAERFPPAIAIARDKIYSIFQDKIPTKQEFLQRYEICLKKILLSLHNNQFIFAEAIKDELGYVNKGEFYWVIGYDGKSAELLWVSDDFFIYRNTAEYFDIDKSELIKLQANECEF